MRALLLAAGLGTRLQPFTHHLPKCLMPVANTPLLGYWLHTLDQLKVDEVVVNLHYLPDRVRRYLDLVSPALKISVVHEPELLNTAGTLHHNADRLRGDSILMVHADNLISCDLAAFATRHAQRPAAAIMSLLSFEAQDPSQCGVIETDADGLVQAFHEKIPNPPGTTSNAAIYLLGDEVLDLCAELAERHGPCLDFSLQIIPQLMGRIHATPCLGQLLDIGSPAALLKAQTLAGLAEIPARYRAGLPAIGDSDDQQLLEQCRQWSDALR